MEYTLTTAQLAKKLGISRNTLNARIYRARQEGDDFFEKYCIKIATLLFWTEEAIEPIKNRQENYKEEKSRRFRENILNEK